MKEYSQRTLQGWVNIGEYLTNQSKKGWDVFYIQRGMWGDPNCWHIILVRDSEHKEVRVGE